MLDIHSIIYYMSINQNFGLQQLFLQTAFGKVFLLFCFVFPLESLNSVLIFDTDENMEYR